MFTAGLLYTLVGTAVLAAVALPRMLHGRPLTLPLLFFGLGTVCYLTPLDLPVLDVVGDPSLVEHLTEGIVVIALAETGLALDRPIGWRSWRTVWRLLGIGMPLTALLLVGWNTWGLGLPLVAAILLATVLTPTDPVLASEVQVHAPSGERHGEDEVRFGLTGESGLNDGLAFLGVYLALTLLTLRQGGEPLTEWSAFLLHDLVWRTVSAILVGVVVGRLLGRMLLRPRGDGDPLAGGAGGLAVLAAAFLGYGLTLLVDGYGFIAAFVTALALRSRDPGHEHHRQLHSYAAGIGQLATALILFALAGPMVRGDLLAALRPGDVLLALAVVLVLRPAAALVALAGGRTGPRERLALAFFGMRGLSSLYYLAFALARVDVAVEPARLWAIVVLVVLVSVAVHGVTAGRVVDHLDRLRRARLAARDVRDPDPAAVAAQHV